MPLVFASHSPVLPACLQMRPIHAAATTACFVTPILRHFFWWCGIRPAARADLSLLLKSGASVVLCPGGVRECLLMERGCDVAYLSTRAGFVRLALQHGASLVPVFCFGQSEIYGWARPGPPWVPQRWLDALSRLIGFVPMLLYGRWGTPVAYRMPMTVVIGRPIPLPKTPQPSRELVAGYLDTFITELSALYERHKAASGYPGGRLKVL